MPYQLKSFLSNSNEQPTFPLRKPSYKERALLADFLEIPISEDPSKESHPLSMKQVVEKAWENWGIGQKKSPEQVISENWDKIVGRKFAGKCAPERLTENTGNPYTIKNDGGEQARPPPFLLFLFSPCFYCRIQTT